jgi:hypothetical protein
MDLKIKIGKKSLTRITLVLILILLYGTICWNPSCSVNMSFNGTNVAIYS